MFEEDEKAEQATEQKTDDALSAPVPAAPAVPVPEAAAATEKPAPAPAEEKQYDEKTAPVPDWMKKRKGK